jgi:glycosyltransferase involved in cell wall biosynthesis
MAKTPLVSIGLPVFNGQKFIRKAIDSILNQDFQDFELIISDNASTDDTGLICREYAARDRRVRYYRNDANIGAAPNHNRVFELASGQYFKWTAHDDDNHPELVRRCVEALERAPTSVVLAYPQAELINEDGEVTGQYLVSVASDSPRPHLRLQKLLACMVLGTPMYGVVRSAALKKTRLHGSFICADYVLLAELAMLGEIVEIPGALLRKRIHPGRSMEAYRYGSREHLAWFDPRNLSRRHLLRASDRLNLEYFRSVWHVPMTTGERISCAIVALIHATIVQGRVARWKQRLRSVLGMKDSRGPAGRSS